MSARVYKVLDAKSALNTKSDIVLGPVELQNATEVAIYVVFSAGTSAGAIQVEESHSPTFGGAWSAVGSPIAWAAANSVKVLRQTGVGMAMRVNISTGIVGGTVDVTIVVK